MLSPNSRMPKIGERVEFASNFVPKALNLLDIGCGDGILSYFIKHKIKKIYGIDNSEEMLFLAKKNGIITKKLDLDVGEFPFPNNFFEVITCLDVIEHIKDPIFLLNEIDRVIKLKGILILSTPNIRFSEHLYSLLVKGVFPKTSLDSQIYDGGHIHFFTYKDLRELLQRTNFIVLKEKGIINKKERGWKGKLIELFLGEQLMNEFRSPGILIIAKKL